MATSYRNTRILVCFPYFKGVLHIKRPSVNIIFISDAEKIAQQSVSYAWDKQAKMFQKSRTAYYEAAVVALHLFLMIPARVVITFALIYAIFYANFFIKFLIILYAFHLYKNWDIHSQGGSRWNAFRQSRYFQYFAQYFPMKLQQRAELPADRNYLVVFHPHGVLFFASILAFAADVFQLEARKGLRTFLTTINSNFWLPVAREYLLATGFVSASEKSLKHLLNDPKGGNLVCLLPGGSAEASYAEPGQYRLYLKKRKGFCRVALETGAWLVPTFSFGEVDCYRTTQPSESLLKFQQMVMRWVGINPVLYKGHSSDIYFAVLPKRTALTVVMGEPIPVVKNANPTLREIEDLHSKYIESIQKLFEAEKHKYLDNATKIELVIQ